VKGSAGGGDLANDGVQVFKHVSRGNSEGSNATLGQPTVTRNIPRGSVSHVVRHSVDFDCQH
jgi:hypothetical protein